MHLENSPQIYLQHQIGLKLVEDEMQEIEHSCSSKKRKVFIQKNYGDINIGPIKTKQGGYSGARLRNNIITSEI